MTKRNIRRKKKKSPVKDRWTLAQGEDNGLPLIFRIRNQRPTGVQPAQYPHLIGMCWSYVPENEFGMPSFEVMALTTQFEKLLGPALESSRSAFMTVIVTGNGVRQWQWYSRDPDETMTLINQALAGCDPFPVWFFVEHDPDWQAYGDFQSNIGT